jgi:hypothetical protein
MKVGNFVQTNGIRQLTQKTRQQLPTFGESGEGLFISIEKRWGLGNMIPASSFDNGVNRRL